ncbi:hypothetical protein [Streptomyces misionensis]|uniref:hypothetical protein n=1 Tax=Streptomyces misionensis TaxID=67331 RepID=UPI00396BE33F
MDRIAQAPPNTFPATSQADEFLRRARSSQLTDPDTETLQRAAARYQITEAVTARVKTVMSIRDLTESELHDLDRMQNTKRQAWITLEAAGRLDLIGGAL